MAALESPRDTEVYAKTPASGADVARPESDLSVADPDFRACEKSSGVPAIAACDRAIASGKFTGRNLSYLYSDRGFMRMQKGAIVAALVDLNEAIEIDSTNFYAFWNRGAIYAAQRDFDSARVDFTTALAQRHPRSQCQALARSLGALGLLTGS
jgi:Flp pilus assembly protein TadD